MKNDGEKDVQKTGPVTLRSSFGYNFFKWFTPTDIQTPPSEAEDDPNIISTLDFDSLLDFDSESDIETDTFSKTIASADFSNVWDTQVGVKWTENTEVLTKLKRGFYVIYQEYQELIDFCDANSMNTQALEKHFGLSPTTTKKYSFKQRVKEFLKSLFGDSIVTDVQEIFQQALRIHENYFASLFLDRDCSKGKLEDIALVKPMTQLLYLDSLCAKFTGRHEEALSTLIYDLVKKLGALRTTPSVTRTKARIIFQEDTSNNPYKTVDIFVSKPFILLFDSSNKELYRAVSIQNSSFARSILKVSNWTIDYAIEFEKGDFADLVKRKI